MPGLDEIYKRLARDWPSEELAARYLRARDHGARAIKNPRPAVARRSDGGDRAAARRHAGRSRLRASHAPRHHARRPRTSARRQRAAERSGRALPLPRALELDGATHSYTAEEWQPVVCDRAAQLVKSARLNEEPPTLVREAQDAISWLSRALIELDQDSAETANALSEALTRLLAVWVFAETSRDLSIP